MENVSTRVFKTFLTSILLFSTVIFFAQSIGINDDGSAPNPMSMLEVKSSTKGLLIPRLTTLERTSMTIGFGELGMMVYDMDLKNFMFFTGADWVPVGDGASLWEEYGTEGITPKNGKTIAIGAFPQTLYKLNIDAGNNIAANLKNNGTTDNFTLKVLNQTGTAGIFATGISSISGYPSTPTAVMARGHGDGLGVFGTSYGAGAGILAQSQGSGPALDAWAFGTGLAGLFRAGDVEMQQDAKVLGNMGVGGSTASFTKLNVTSTDRARAGYFYNSFNSSSPTYGVYGGAFGTGSGNKRGGAFDASGGTGENIGVRGFAQNGSKSVGVYGYASGATTNWAGHFDAGDVIIDDELGVGTTNPTSKVHVEGAASSTQTVLNSVVNYAGTSDVRAVRGYSLPAPGYGYGGEFTGSYRGVLGTANGQDYTGTVIGVYANAFGTSATGTRTGIYGTASGGSKNWAGYFASGHVYVSNDLRIGSASTDGHVGYKVVIDGKMIAEEVRIQNSTAWPDYVFEDSYKLLSLHDVADHIAKTNHLPGIPSAEEIKENGHHLGDIQVRLLEKIEELTLYMIDMKGDLDAIKDELKNVKDENAELQTQLRLNQK
jgi:hypothetical protein